MVSFTLKTRFLCILATFWLRSLRISFTPPPLFVPGIIGIWHRDLMACCGTFKGKGIQAMISLSKDGDSVTYIAQKMGYKVSRGSDTQGAANVRHLLKTLKKDGFVAMALDGPRGPAMEVKPGSPWLSKASGRPLWLVEVSYGAHLTLKTWDKFVVPLPFSKIRVQVKEADTTKMSKKYSSDTN